MRTNRMRIPVAILAATLALSCTSIAAAAEFTHPTFLAAAKAANHIPAFPGAEGAGMYSLGGRGGKVYEVVRTTDDSEPGSFRYALEAEGP
ncbi:MAG TPA: hypothetical protein VLH60_06370, partial [Sedimentisphaerales bacterium]|nr:hypothetical protein [Sedimentisphaerales bacterium]